MRNSGIRFLLVILFSLQSTVLSAQSIKNRGIPVIINYDKSIYRAGTQNWSCAQDTRGLLYFGNTQGIIEFDGSFWRIYQVPNKSAVHAICLGNDGLIYAGAFNEIGFLKPVGNGKLKFYSLLDKIPLEKRNFGDIWKIYNTESGLIFQSFTTIFLYQKDSIHNISNNCNFHFSFLVNKRYFVKENGTGLIEFHGDKKILIKNGELFSDQEIWGMLPLSENKILIATAENGLFVLDKDDIYPWNINANDWLRKNQIFSVTEIGNKYFAIGTVQNGLLIIDKNGNSIQHLNKNKGLQNNTILSVYCDKDYNLWLGLDNGIDYIKTNSPLTFLSPRKEIGAGYVSCLFNGNIYLGTNQGLFIKNWKDYEDPLSEGKTFNLIPNTMGQVWTLSNANNNLLCGHNKGSYIINNEVPTNISSYPGAWKFISIPGYPDFLIEGTYAGLILLRKENGSWTYVANIKGFNESARIIEPADTGAIWISHEYLGLYKIKLSPSLDSITEKIHYSINDGLPCNNSIQIFRIKNEVVFSSEGGISVYNKKSGRFEDYHWLSKLVGKHKINQLYETVTGDIWFYQEGEIKVLKPNFDGTCRIEKLTFPELKDQFIKDFENLNVIDESNVIIGNENGFVHFDPSLVSISEKYYPVLIRSVSVNGKDSVVFAGNYTDSLKNAGIIPQISFSLNNVCFQFSSTNYSALGKVLYSYFLEGFDTNWSDWTNSTSKEYSNLHDGKYIFKVKTQNNFQSESEIVQYQLIILPPWYRSTYAYVAYLILLIAAIYIIWINIKKSIEKEREKLRQKQIRLLKEQEENHEKEKIKSEQEIIKLKNDMLEIENLRNKSELENKTKELASITFQMVYRNELLTKIKTKLEKVNNQFINEGAKKQISALIQTIENDLIGEEDWERFEMHFDSVYENFLKKIRAKFPELKPKDLKLCAYLRMNLSSKEIAPLLNISVRGVEISRYRLRKKIHLDRDINLTDFLFKNN